MPVERWWLVLILIAQLAGAPASAQGAQWRTGTAQWHRQLQRWEHMPAPRRQAILRAQRRYRRLSPAEQRRLFEQYRRQRR